MRREDRPHKMHEAPERVGATDYNAALYYAASGGHVGCMRLSKKWGATDFANALKITAPIRLGFVCPITEERKRKCAKLLERWKAEAEELAEEATNN